VNTSTRWCQCRLFVLLHGVIADAESLPMLLLPRPPLLLLLLPLPGPSPYLPPACSLTTEHGAHFDADAAFITRQRLATAAAAEAGSSSSSNSNSTQQQEDTRAAATLLPAVLASSLLGPAAAWGTGQQYVTEPKAH